MVEPDYYVFEGFRVDPQRRLLLRTTGEPVPITDRAFDTLVLLLENWGQVVERERFFREVWHDAAVEPNNLDQSIYVLRNALGDTKDPRSFIRSVPRKGFTFLKEVTRASASTAVLSEIEANPPSANQLGKTESPTEASIAGATANNLPADYLFHIITSSALYALLYALALLLEVAYNFDDYTPMAVGLAILIFFLVFTASLVGLWLDQKQTLDGKQGGLALCTSLIVLTGLLVYGLLGFFLPHSPITKANFQTYPAHSAYLKDVSYFLVLAFSFMIIPFHFILSVKREIREGKQRSALNLLMGKRRGIAPGGAAFLRPWWLVVLLVIAAAASQLGMARLIENLKPGEHINLFTALAEARRLNYFVLGIECLIWYYRALNELKKECLDALSSRVEATAHRA
jgi:DNA-binding winged helix-turn-helix (wHTH) protein